MTNTTNCFVAKMGFLLLCISTTTQFCEAQIKYPVTPYTKVPASQDLALHRSIADQTRWIRDFKPTAGTGSITAYSLRLGYAATGKPATRPLTTLVGEANGVRVEIRLGDIEQITVIGRNKVTATLRIAVFPALDERTLLLQHPSYTVLRTNFRKSITLDVSLRDASASEYCLLGQATSDDPDTDLGPRVLFREVDLNKPINLRYLSPEIWWATLSVFTDRSYPYTDTKSTSSYSDHPITR